MESKDYALLNFGGKMERFSILLNTDDASLEFHGNVSDKL